MSTSEVNVDLVNDGAVEYDARFVERCAGMTGGATPMLNLSYADTCEGDHTHVLGLSAAAGDVLQAYTQMSVTLTANNTATQTAAWQPTTSHTIYGARRRRPARRTSRCRSARSSMTAISHSAVLERGVHDDAHPEVVSIPPIREHDPTRSPRTRRARSTPCSRRSPNRRPWPPTRRSSCRRASTGTFEPATNSVTISGPRGTAEVVELYTNIASADAVEVDRLRTGGDDHTVVPEPAELSIGAPDVTGLITHGEVQMIDAFGESFTDILPTVDGDSYNWFGGGARFRAPGVAMSSVPVPVAVH